MVRQAKDALARLVITLHDTYSEDRMIHKKVTVALKKSDCYVSVH